MNNKIEQLRQRLIQMDETSFTEMLNEGNHITQAEINKKNANYVKTDYLVFKPEKIKELAKSFTSAQAMVDFKGENKLMINAAGRLIHRQQTERPEWFEEIKEALSLEECLIIAKKYNNYGKFYKNEKTIYDRILKLLGYDKMKSVLEQWMTGFVINYTDDYICSILKKYKKAIDLKGTKDSHIRTKLQVDKGSKFPKAYTLYREMMSVQGNKKGLKRGSYEQRTPQIEQYDLDNNLIYTFETWKDVIAAGFNRNSVTNAINGADGHHRHKKFIWKYKSEQN